MHSPTKICNWLVLNMTARSLHVAQYNLINSWLFNFSNRHIDWFHWHLTCELSHQSVIYSNTIELKVLKMHGNMCCNNALPWAFCIFNPTVPLHRAAKKSGPPNNRLQKSTTKELLQVRTRLAQSLQLVHFHVFNWKRSRSLRKRDLDMNWCCGDTMCEIRSGIFACGSLLRKQTVCLAFSRHISSARPRGLSSPPCGRRPSTYGPRHSGFRIRLFLAGVL
jgi:hypothetical protein